MSRIKWVDLKPCPFCGSKGDTLALLQQDEAYPFSEWEVGCCGCDAGGPKRKDIHEAVEAWNKRSEK